MFPSGPRAAQPLDEPRAALQRPLHQGQVQVVDEQPALRQARPPGLVQLAAEGIGRLPLQLRRHEAADHVVVDGEPRARQAAQQGLADLLAIVQLLVVSRFERKTLQTKGLDQQAIAGEQGDVVDVLGVRKPGPDRGLLPRQLRAQSETDVRRGHGA
jgi:hypothetical protein